MKKMRILSKSGNIRRIGPAVLGATDWKKDAYSLPAPSSAPVFTFEYSIANKTTAPIAITIPVMLSTTFECSDSRRFCGNPSHPTDKAESSQNNQAR